MHIQKRSTNDRVNGKSEQRDTKMKKTKKLSMAALVLLLAVPVSAHALNVGLEDGTLTIKGTAKNDWITVSGNGTGSVEVRSGKRANVAEGSYATVSDIVVKAKGGRNQVSLNGVSVPGSVKVKAGSGNDTVSFAGQFSAGGDLTVDLNGGNNTVTMDAEASIAVEGSAEFDGNKGNDKVTLSSITTGQHLMIGMSGGQDKVVLGKKNSYQVSIGKRLTIAGGRGNNTINVYGAEVSSAIRLMSGRDVDKYTILDTRTDGFFDVKSGGGDDRIVSRRNTVMEDYRIRCGGGSDSVITKNDVAAELVQKRCSY